MAVYYVVSGGSDAADGLSVVNGWASIQFAADTAVGGDEVRICTGFVITSTINFDTNAGANNNLIKFTGADSSGVVTGTRPILTGFQMSANTDIFYLNIANLSISFENLDIRSARRYNVNISPNVDGAIINFTNVHIRTALSTGVFIQETDGNFTPTFTNCYIYDNNSYGIAGSGGSRGGISAFYCDISHNGNSGIREQGGAPPKAKYVGCSFYRNVNHGLDLPTVASRVVIVDCIFVRNTQDGFFVSSNNAVGIICANNIFKSNGRYGINANTNNVHGFSLLDYNCSNGNTSGHININGGVLPGYHNIIADPLFISETSGSEDFRLKTTPTPSPCLNVGLGYNG